MLHELVGVQRGERLLMGGEDSVVLQTAPLLPPCVRCPRTNGEGMRMSLNSGIRHGQTKRLPKGLVTRIAGAHQALSPRASFFFRWFRCYETRKGGMSPF
ncbi:hypothetical protein GW17_00041251, partial [Ensete ventricosum]